MAVTASDTLADIDEALGHLAAGLRDARTNADGFRSLQLGVQVDHLLEHRHARTRSALDVSAGRKNPAPAESAADCSQPFSPRHPENSGSAPA